MAEAKTSKARPAKPVAAEKEAPAANAKSAGFALVELGDKPEAPTVFAKQMRKDLMANLVQIQEKPGVYFEVAQYATPKGAQNVIDSIVAGKQALPACPEGWEYDIEPQQRENPTGVGRRHSVVIAAFVESEGE